MQYVLRFRIAPRRSADFRAWLQANADDLGRDAPEGWSFDGAYFVVRGFGDYDCEMRWYLENYAALDSANPPGFNERVKEWLEFVSDASPTQATLLKNADEVVIIG